MPTLFCRYCFFLYYSELRMTEELSKHACVLILKESFIFLNSLHICYYPDFWFYSQQIKMLSFGSETSTLKFLVFTRAYGCIGFH